MAYDKLVDSAKLDATFKGIADAIRRNQNATEPIHIDNMPSRINEVHQDGYMKGFEEGKNSAEQDGYNNGLTEGVAIGKQLEYDRFWDAYQQNGKRTDYQTGFTGAGWTEETFKPKYDIVTNSAYMLFRGCPIKDLGEAIRNSGKKVVVNHNRLQYSFNFCPNLETVEEIEFKNPLVYISQAFTTSPKLKKIQTLPISEEATTLDFTDLSALEDVSFSGVIPVNISFAKSSKLSNASIQSIIDHLKDLTGQTAKTLTFHATVGGKLTDAQKATITAKNWTLVY